jgi:serine/threonine protein kinase
LRINTAATISTIKMSLKCLNPGTKFNQRWTIDKKIGEGSCGSVYSVKERDSEVGELIMKCIQLPKGTSKADKELMKMANTLSYERTLYKGVLNGMTFCAALPLFHYYGEEHGFRYLIMQRLDCDLREYMNSYPASAIPVAEIVNIGLAILEGLEAIHNRGHLYVDVKPDNFMMLRDHPSALSDGTIMHSKLFFVDFGLVEKFTSVQAGGEERERTSRKAIAGTPSFASVDVLSGFSPSRKDDIEALVKFIVFTCLLFSSI